MDTADIIFDLLEKKGDTQQAFADAIGVSKNKVSEWKAKKTKSYKNHINEIAAYFNISTDYLLGNEQKNKPAISSGELQEKLKPLYEITKDFTDEERAALVEYAEFLAAKRKKSNLE